MLNDIAIVIPILNEADTLPHLFKLLCAQTLLPKEIIFVDGGSTDSSNDLINGWSNKSNNCIKIIVNKGGAPGANRNIGIKETDCDWIAFIDAGVYPERDWLEELSKCAMQENVKAVFGVCHFNSDRSFEKAVCALSYGCDTIESVLPSSLFHKDIFVDIGHFKEGLRSTEDTLWIKKFEKTYGARTICSEALVHYPNFPDSLGALVHKWRLYEENAVNACLHRGQQLFFALFFLIIIMMILVSPMIGFLVLLIYVLIRGILDPMRRSRSLFWWKKRPTSLFIALGLGIVIDTSKTIGSITGHLKAIFR
jgi:glycosyltransferase involved in cell wall biosynthesis